MRWPEHQVDRVRALNQAGAASPMAGQAVERWAPQGAAGGPTRAVKETLREAKRFVWIRP